MSTAAPAPTTRHDRRRLELEQRREQRRAARENPTTSPLRSPMVLFTGAAALIGILIIGFMLLTRPGPPSVADLTAPDSDVPAAAVVDGRTMGSPTA